MKRILFLRLNAIGDVVQAAAALRLLRDMHPNDHIVWAVDEALVNLVAAFNVADRVIGIDASNLFAGSLRSRLWHLVLAMWKLGCSGNYDVVYCAHPNWRFRLLDRFVRTKQRISPNSMDRCNGFITQRNRVFEYFRMLTSKDAGSLNIDRALAQIGRSALSRIERNDIQRFGLPEQYLVLVAGGAKNALRDDPLRRWPIENYVLLARLLQSRGHQVVLLGGPGDHWVSNSFTNDGVIDLIGKTSLLDMIELLDKASCVIAHDSGPLHLASITSTPLVALFGPTSANAVVSFSRLKTTIFESGNRVSCSPCYDGRNYAVCTRAVCMDEIPVSRVVEAVVSLIQD